MENPNACMKKKVPTSDTGTAIAGIREVLEEDEHYQEHEQERLYESPEHR